MLGAITGDIVGSRFEHNNHKSKEFELFSRDCSVTDDSILTLAIAKAIIETEKIISPSVEDPSFDSDYDTLLESMTIKYMQELGQKYPYCGFGGMFRKWVQSINPQPYNSFGNGAAMRISPVGFAARTESELYRLSEIITATTHNHEDGIKGAEATALAIFMARIGYTKDEIRDKINRNYYYLDFTIEEIKDIYTFDVTSQGSVPQVIVAFLESKSFEDAIRTAISIGGDSDTIAAITGSIAEAYYGVPQSIKDVALSYLDNDLLSIYNEWNQLIGNENNNKYKVLTKYIGKIEFAEALEDRFGREFIDIIHKESKEKPYSMSYLNLNDLVESFVQEFYEFSHSHTEYKINEYHTILEKNGIKWEDKSMRNVDINSVDAECILALIMGTIRAERFCDGALLGFFKDGFMLELLKKLKSLDSANTNKEIEEIYLGFGGFGTIDSYHIIINEGKALMKTIEWKKDTIKTQLTREGTIEILKDFNNINTEYWRRQYIEPYTFSGEWWELRVKYESQREFVWVGNDYYPPNWKELLNIFGIALEM